MVSVHICRIRRMTWSKWHILSYLVSFRSAMFSEDLPLVSLYSDHRRKSGYSILDVQFSILFFTHNTLLSFPGLCLPLALAICTCMQDLSPHPWGLTYPSHPICSASHYQAILSHLISTPRFLTICLNAEKTETKPRTAQQAASGNSQKCHSGQMHCSLGPECPPLSTPIHQKEGNDASWAWITCN